MLSSSEVELVSCGSFSKVGCFVLASFGLNEFVFTSFQRKKERGIAKKVQLLGNDVPLAVAATPRRRKCRPRRLSGPDWASPNGARERLAARAPRTLPATGASPLRPADRSASNCSESPARRGERYPVALRLKTSYSSRDSNSGRGSSRAKYRSCRSFQLHLR